MQAEPEVRQRDASDGDEHAEHVEGAAAVDGGDDADDDADQHRPGDRADRQVDRNGQTGREELGHRRVVRVRDAQVTVEDAGDPLDVLRDEGLVEAKLLADCLDLAGSRRGTGNLASRVTRDEVDEQEDKNGDDEQERDHAKDPLEDVLPHGTPSL